MQIIRTVKRAVDELGGDSAIASDLGIGQSAVGNWKIRGFLPAKRYIYFNTRLAKFGMTIDLDLFPEMRAGNGKTTR